MKTIKAKKISTYVTIAVFCFLGGVEYAVILPTLWQYLKQRFKAEQVFLGIILSAFSVSDLLTSPLLGRWADVTRQTKWIVFFANFWEIGGSIMYFLGISKWFMLGSRLVAGVGSGASGAIIADIARSTSKEERTSILAVVMLCRQLGLIIGPACNMFLRELNFKIGSYPVDAFTAPGLFMAILWTLHQLMVLFLYHDLPKLYAEENKNALSYSYSSNGKDQNGDEADPPDSPWLESNHYDPIDSSTPQKERSITRSENINNSDLENNSYIHVVEGNFPSTSSGSKTSISKNDQSTFSNSSNMIESAEQMISSGRDISQWRKDVISPANNYGAIKEVDSISDSGSADSTEIKGKLRLFYNEYIREEVAVILLACFCSFFSQTGVEAMVTPITDLYLDWGEFENSLMYFSAGIEIVFVFLIVRCLSKVFLDSTILSMGLFINISSTIYMLVYFPQAPTHSKSNLIPFIIGCFINVLSLPLLVVCSVSLYSKVVGEKNQGLSQGLRRSISGVGTILGPLWTGSLVSRLYLMFSVMISVSVLSFFLILISLRRLRQFEHKPTPRNIQIQDEEKQPEESDGLLA